MMMELRRATRSLLRTPSFALPLVATVALSVGIITTTFAILYGILFRPLPYADDGRLVRLYNHYGMSNDRGTDISPPDFADRAASHSFSSSAVWQTGTAVLGGTEAVRVASARVSADFFRTLGVGPMLGRLSNDADAIVLSYGAWQRRFGGSRSAVGRTAIIDGRQCVIAAVMPPTFAYPTGDVELWRPLILKPTDFSDLNRGSEYLDMIARLAPRATIAAAQSEADLLSKRLIDRVPGRRHFLAESHWHVVIRGLKEDLVADVRGPLILLLAAATLVFAIGAANAISLVLARVASREKETSVRRALGASSFRSAAPRIAEGWIAVAAGGVGGILLTSALTSAVLRSGSVLIGRPEAVRLDAPVLGFALLVTAVCAVIVTVASSIRPNFGSTVPGRFASVALGRFRSALVVVEVALATALLIAGSLVIESVRRLSAGDPGFRPHGALTFRITAPEAIRNDNARIMALFGGIQQRLRILPGVTAVSATSVLPFSSDDNTSTFFIEGRPEVAGAETPSGKYRRILPGWNAAMGVPLLRGRMFDDRDTPTSPRYAVIDEAAAKRYWPGQEPLGKRITYQSLDARVIYWREIIGVVGSVRHGSLGERPVPHVYFDGLQVPEMTMTFVVRSEQPRPALIAGVRAAVGAVDPTVPIDRIESLDDYVASSLAQPRFGSAILAAFGAVALFLTCVGLYGLLAYVVTERRREFAIRMAVGANARSVLQLVLLGGLRLAGVGVVLGMLAALAAGSALRSVLYSVTATNPLAYTGVAIALTCVALLASWIPAHRAAALDPAVALRVE